MIDLDRMTNDPTYDDYAYRPRHHIYRDDEHRQLQRRSILAMVIIGVIAFIIGMAVHSAHAEGYIVSCDTSVGVTCFAGPLVNPYVREVPQPTTADEKAAAADRERLWVAHCDPQIAFDRYGVARYHYKAPGCEFGR